MCSTTMYVLKKYNHAIMQTYYVRNLHVILPENPCSVALYARAGPAVFCVPSNYHAHIILVYVYCAYIQYADAILRRE